jgi:hypothetical protein
VRIRLTHVGHGDDMEPFFAGGIGGHERKPAPSCNQTQDLLLFIAV